MPKWRQDGTKIAPRSAKMEPRWPKIGGTMGQDGTKIGQRLTAFMLTDADHYGMDAFVDEYLRRLLRGRACKKERQSDGTIIPVRNFGEGQTVGLQSLD